MSCPFYRDYGKSANDLLNKGFPSTDNFDFKVEVTGPAPKGGNATFSFQKSYTGVVEGSASGSFQIGDIQCRSEVTLKEEGKLELTRPPHEKWGYKIKPTIEFTSGLRSLIDSKIKGAVDLRGEIASVTGHFIFPWKTFLPTFNSSVLFQHQKSGVAFGAEVEANDKCEPQLLNSVLAWNGFTGFFKKKYGSKVSTKVGFNYYTKLPDSEGWKNTFIAAELGCELGDKPVLSFGASWKPDELSSLKTRINTKGTLGLALTQKMKGPFTLTVSGDLNALDLNAANSLRTAFKLSIA